MSDRRIPLTLDDLRVTSFEPGLQPVLTTLARATEPSTYEDTCIKMCPTDDTCTMLGCQTQIA